MFLCCHVVKLGIAKKQRQKTTPQSGSTSGLHVPKLLLFCCFVVFPGCSKHYKYRFFEDFDMLIFVFLGSKISRSITWPHFCIFWKMWPSY